MLRRSTFQLLRFHFSFFLMPVYWFALGQVTHINVWRATLIFFILHLLVYPASNGYNSYMDRDEGPIGGVMNPQQPTKQLFIVSVLFDCLAIALGLLISIYFVIGIIAYILASRAYSYRGIRLKRFPILGYLTVTIFQGAVVFFLVYHGSEADQTLKVPVLALIASSLLVGGFYPLTQVYQHEADRKDGVRTISSLLGYRGTFVFAAVVYSVAFGLMGLYFTETGQAKEFLILATAMLPVIVYFLIWAISVWNNSENANFSNTMRMNKIASFGINIGFIIILLMH